MSRFSVQTTKLDERRATVEDIETAIGDEDRARSEALWRVVAQDAWADPAVGACLAPTTIGEFFAHTIERRWLHVPAGDHVRPHRDLYSFNQLCRDLRRQRIRPRSLRVLGERAPDPASLWIENDEGTWIDWPQVQRAILDECSISVFWPELYHEPSDALCRAFARTLCCTVQSFCYYTPPRAQSYDTHWDEEDLFVLQLEGRKNWELWEPLIALPERKTATMLPERFGGYTERLEGVSIELGPGDLLYVPRGTPHRVTTSSDACLHLTFRLVTPTWARVLERMGDVALQRCFLRADFRDLRPIHGRPGLSDRDRNRRLDVLLEEFRSLSPVDALRTLVSQDLVRHPVPVPLDRVAADTVLQRWAGSLLVEEDESGIRVTHGTRELRVPLQMTEAVTWIQRQNEIRVRDLPGLEKDEQIAFAQALVRNDIFIVLEASGLCGDQIPGLSNGSPEFPSLPVDTRSDGGFHTRYESEEVRGGCDEPWWTQVRDVPSTFADGLFPEADPRAFIRNNYGRAVCKWRPTSVGSHIESVIRPYSVEALREDLLRQRIPLEDLLGKELGEHTGAQSLTNYAAALRWLNLGQGSLVVNNLDRHCPTVGTLCAALSETFAASVGCGAYFTPPVQQTFEPHFDTFDVFVVQLHGQKHWNLWEPHLYRPVHRWPEFEFPPFSDFAPSGRQRIETLEVGDVLYLPCGVPHAPVTAGELSFHLTFHIENATWSALFDEVIRGSVSEMVKEVAFREACPAGFVRGEVLQEQFRPRMTRFAEILRAVAAEDHVAELAAVEPPLFVPRADIGVQAAVTRRACPVSLDSSAATVRFLDRQLAFPFRCRPALEYIVANRDFRIADMPAGSDSERQAIALRLINEGLLIP